MFPDSEQHVVAALNLCFITSRHRAQLSLKYDDVFALRDFSWLRAFYCMVRANGSLEHGDVVIKVISDKYAFLETLMFGDTKVVVYHREYCISKGGADSVRVIVGSYFEALYAAK